MTIEYLKKATPPQDAIDNATSEAVDRILADIQTNGRDAVEKYARDLDGWHGPIVVSEDDIAKASKALSQGVKDDIAFAHARVKDFAHHQRESLHRQGGRCTAHRGNVTRPQRCGGTPCHLAHHESVWC